MFKFITALIALITAINSYSVTPAKDAPSKEEQHKMYEEFLVGVVHDNDWGDIDTSVPGPGWFSQSDTSKWYYAYFDMNSDGIDELLVGESVTKPAKTVLQFIVTICDGKVTPMKDFIGYFPEVDDYFPPTLYSNGTVVENEVPMNTDDTFYRHIRLENGELKTVVLINSDTETRGMWELSVDYNGEKNECKIPGFIAKILINILNRGEVVEPDWQPMSEIAQP